MGKPRAFTDEQERNEIAPKYRAGALLCDLAAEYGVTTMTIVRALNRAGVQRRKAAPRGGIPRPRPNSRLFDEEQSAVLASRYQEGALVHELAAEAGVSRKAVNNALRRQGVQLRDKRDSQAHLNRRRREKGERHPNFKGGRIGRPDGYVAVSIPDDDPMFEMAKSRGRLSKFGWGYVLEHRLVMARHLNRPLTRYETVHHIDGDRSNNRLENLQLRSGKHGKGRKLVCADCGSENVREVPI